MTVKTNFSRYICTSCDLKLFDQVVSCVKVLSVNGQRSTVKCTHSASKRVEWSIAVFLCLCMCVSV